jgi:serine/threonine protein kinase
VLDQATLQTECLNQETLRAYWDGLLSEDQISSVEDHLGACSACLTQFRELESTDKSNDLVGPLREMVRNASLPLGPLGPEEVSPIVQRAKGLQTIQTVGPYRLLESLGQGGMGTVFLAEHTKLHKQVAIKLVHFPKQNTDAKSRFEREVLAVGKLQHPSIVAATDAGQDDELQYLVMEYVRGLDLSQMCRRIKQIPIADVCEIGRQVAMALSYAHSQGFVHRDIKPSNIMLDEAGVVKLLDFGLVMFDQWDSAVSELTTVGQFLGTLDYIAPEQAERSGAVDHRADLYALGATLFRLLCGRGPLAAMPNLSPIEKLRLLAHHKPPLLEVLRPDAPKRLCQLINELLQTNPQHRPPSAAHVAQALEPHCSTSNLKTLMATAKGTPDTVENKLLPILSPVEVPSRPKLTWGSFGRMWGWIATACLLMAFLAGLILRWETNEGQLVVESELSGAEIKIKRNDDGSESSLKIETGNVTTKLRAGQYTLEMASPSDGVSLENNAFVVTRGQTVIARVRLERTTDNTKVEKASEDAKEASTEPESQEPLYQGKTLKELLRLTRFERYRGSWRDGASGAIYILGADADQELFDEIYGIIRKHDDFDLLGNWQDGRVGEKLLEEIDRSSDAERRSLLRQIGRRFQMLRVEKIAKWIEDQFTNGNPNAHELFRSLIGFDVYEGPTGRLTRYDNEMNANSWFKRFEDLESVCPALAHRYGELVVQIQNDGSIVEYQLRTALRLLREKETSFSASVFALSYVMNAKRQGWYSKDLQPGDWSQLIENTVVQLLARVPEELNSECTYTTQFGMKAVLTDLPGEKSAAVALIRLASQINFGLKTDPVFLETLEKLRVPAEEAWNLYKSLDERDVLSTIRIVWEKGSQAKLTSKGKKDLPQNVKVEELFQKTKALVLHQYIFEAWSNNPYASSLPPSTLSQWVGLLERFDSNGNFLLDESELDESTKLSMRVIGSKLPQYPLTLEQFLSTKFPTVVNQPDAPVDARLRDWVEKRIRLHDTDQNKKLDAVEFKNLMPDQIMADYDLNQDGFVDVNELAIKRSKQMAK